MKKKYSILVTGISTGIGKTIAEGLAASGHKVVGFSRNPIETSYNIRWMKVDVTDREAVFSKIDQLNEQNNTIEVLINNAGVGMVSAFEETPLSDWEKLMQININGVINCMQGCIPHMRNNHFGIIINITSIAGKIGLPYRSFYSASKYAIEGLTEAIRMEVDQFGIQVCSLAPGDVNTSINQNRKFVLQKNSPYSSELQAVNAQVFQHVSSGISPERILKKILKVIDSDHIKPQYTVAAPLQAVAPWIKRLLGNRLFEKLLRRNLGMPRK